MNALDFSEVRSKRDADLLAGAKTTIARNGKMSPEEYAALRRKIGGTARDYWKDWVEVDVVEARSVKTTSNSANGALLLGAITLAGVGFVLVQVLAQAPVAK